MKNNFKNTENKLTLEDMLPIKTLIYVQNSNRLGFLNLYEQNL